MPAIVTDLNASIIEANIAALELFRREGRHVERKPLSALIENDSRAEFREQLKQATAIREPRRFRLLLHRVGDLPIEVHATVALIPELGPISSGVLFWMFDPPSEDGRG